MYSVFVFFFFKQKTAYEMRISDWSSDVCSSDLFVRDQAAPSASVILKLQPGRALSDAQVRSVVNLVASSVPGMKPDSVTVVDQMRSEERRVGKECVSTCRSRWSPYH